MASKSDNQTILIIGALGLGAYFLLSQRDKVGEAIGGISEGISGVGYGVSSAFQGTGYGIGTGVAGLGSGISQAATGLGQGISGIGQGVYDIATETGETIKAPADFIQEGFKGAQQNLREGLQDVGDIQGNILGTFEELSGIGYDFTKSLRSGANLKAAAASSSLNTPLRIAAAAATGGLSEIARKGLEFGQAAAGSIRTQFGQLGSIFVKSEDKAPEEKKAADQPKNEPAGSVRSSGRSSGSSRSRSVDTDKQIEDINRAAREGRLQGSSVRDFGTGKKLIVAIQPERDAKGMTALDRRIAERKRGLRA